MREHGDLVVSSMAFEPGWRSHRIESKVGSQPAGYSTAPGHDSRWSARGTVQKTGLGIQCFSETGSSQGVVPASGGRELLRLFGGRNSYVKALEMVSEPQDLFNLCGGASFMRPGTFVDRWTAAVQNKGNVAQAPVSDDDLFGDGSLTGGAPAWAGMAFNVVPMRVKRPAAQPMAMFGDILNRSAMEGSQIGRRAFNSDLPKYVAGLAKFNPNLELRQMSWLLFSVWCFDNVVPPTVTQIDVRPALDLTEADWRTMDWETILFLDLSRMDPGQLGLLARFGKSLVVDVSNRIGVNLAVPALVTNQFDPVLLPVVDDSLSDQDKLWAMLLAFPPYYMKSLQHNLWMEVPFYDPIDHLLSLFEKGGRTATWTQNIGASSAVTRLPVGMVRHARMFRTFLAQEILQGYAGHVMDRDPLTGVANQVYTKLVYCSNARMAAVAAGIMNGPRWIPYEYMMAHGMKVDIQHIDDTIALNGTPMVGRPRFSASMTMPAGTNLMVTDIYGRVQNYVNSGDWPFHPKSFLSKGERYTVDRRGTQHEMIGVDYTVADKAALGQLFQSPY